jgi:UDP:flavonoid glycosyltransferase YjiC (YdhE family)
VLVAAPESFAAPVKRAGYDFWPCADLPEDSWRAVMAKLEGLDQDTANGLVMREVFANLNAHAVLPRMFAAVEEWRPDVILRESCEFASYIAAERAGLPHVCVGVTLGEFETSLPELVSAPVAELRVSAGLAPDPDGDRLWQAPFLTLAPVSLGDPASSGRSHVRRFREPALDTPAQALPLWWADDDDPLVYVTFGSVVGGSPEVTAVLRAVVEALADLPVRLLVTLGDWGDPAGWEPTPPNLHVERWVPQAQVLPHTAATVCHGGSGTVLGSLAHGVPLVVVPLFADQPQNARRIAEIGAGLAVEVEPTHSFFGVSVDPTTVVAALRQVLAEPGFRSAAWRVAEEIRALPPTDAAVDMLRDIVTTRTR